MRYFSLERFHQLIGTYSIDIAVKSNQHERTLKFLIVAKRFTLSTHELTLNSKEARVSTVRDERPRNNLEGPGKYYFEIRFSDFEIFDESYSFTLSEEFD